MVTVSVGVVVLPPSLLIRAVPSGPYTVSTSSLTPTGPGQVMLKVAAAETARYVPGVTVMWLVCTSTVLPVFGQVLASDAPAGTVPVQLSEVIVEPGVLGTTVVPAPGVEASAAGAAAASRRPASPVRAAVRRSGRCRDTGSSRSVTTRQGGTCWEEFAAAAAAPTGLGHFCTESLPMTPDGPAPCRSSGRARRVVRGGQAVADRRRRSTASAARASAASGSRAATGASGTTGAGAAAGAATNSSGPSIWRAMTPTARSACCR